MMFTVLMITLAVNAQSSDVIHVKMFRSYHSYPASPDDIYEEEIKDMTIHINRKENCFIVYNKGVKLFFNYLADNYFQKDGFVSLTGYAEESTIKELVYLQIDLSNTGDDMVRLTLGREGVWNTYVGYTY